MLTDAEYYKTKYIKAQGNALTGCNNNNANFPLGLTRQPSKQISAQDLVYDYPYLRLSSETLMKLFTI
jgi:hypothetical protein